MSYRNLSKRYSRHILTFPRLMACPYGNNSWVLKLFIALVSNEKITKPNENNRKRATLSPEGIEFKFQSSLEEGTVNETGLLLPAKKKLRSMPSAGAPAYILLHTLSYGPGYFRHAQTAWVLISVRPDSSQQNEMTQRITNPLRPGGLSAL